MRDLLSEVVNRYRALTPAVMEYYGSFGNNKEGVFILTSPIDQKILKVIATNAEGWDHVSVSREDRTPTWEEMEHVKRTFFYPHELVMQFHVPEALHINCHSNCLHLWRPHKQNIELPPREFV